MGVNIADLYVKGQLFNPLNDYVDTDGGKVINTTHYATENAPSLRRCLSVKPDSIKPLADKIYKLMIICKNWLDVTDSEFILDPDYYVIT